MRSPFNSPIRITQKFGEDFINPHTGRLTYKAMGINGHNGIDIVPIKADWSMYNMMPGRIMILKYDNGYGYRIAIWNAELNVTEYHNHLTGFNPDLKLYDDIKARTYIGEMGNSGFSFGAHDHFALARTDNNANRINLDNGYKGYIDPLPFLKNTDKIVIEG